MGFRFRRSIRLAPGIRVNLSKTGTSLSLGHRGATVNFGPKGEKLTIGMPGTGVSYSEMLQPGERRSPDSRQSKGGLKVSGLFKFLGIFYAALLIGTLIFGLFVR